MSSTPFLDSVTIRGGGMTKKMREQCVKASLNGSMSEVTQLEMSFVDPGFAILRSGLFTLKASVDIDDFSLEIANIGLGEVDSVEAVTVKCRPRAVRKLKERRGTKVMKRVSPSQFVISECKAVGIKYQVQGSAVRKIVARDIPKKGSQEVDNPPSSWTTFQRLAQELGYVCFEIAGVIHFGRPSWMLSNNTAANTVQARYRSGADDYGLMTSIPTATRSLDSPAQSVDCEMRVTSAKRVRTGMRVEISGVPTFDGKYLVTDFSLDLMDTTQMCDFTAGTALNPDPGQDTKTQNRRGTRLSSDFAYWAQKQVGNKYSSTVEVNTGAFDPNVFNGEELVEWAAAQVGAFMPEGANNQIEYCENFGLLQPVSTGIKRRGSLLWKKNTMSISLGNGQVIEPVHGRIGIRKKAKASQYTKSGRVPGIKYW